jgi:hypothetical protein
MTSVRKKERRKAGGHVGTDARSEDNANQYQVLECIARRRVNFDRKDFLMLPTLSEWKEIK